jgi:hypothetical protein
MTGAKPSCAANGRLIAKANKVGTRKDAVEVLLSMVASNVAASVIKQSAICQ